MTANWAVLLLNLVQMRCHTMLRDGKVPTIRNWWTLGFQPSAKEKVYGLRLFHGTPTQLFTCECFLSFLFFSLVVDLFPFGVKQRRVDETCPFLQQESKVHGSPFSSISPNSFGSFPGRSWAGEKPCYSSGVSMLMIAPCLSTLPCCQCACPALVTTDFPASPNVSENSWPPKPVSRSIDVLTGLPAHLTHVEHRLAKLQERTFSISQLIQMSFPLGGVTINISPLSPKTTRIFNYHKPWFMIVNELTNTDPSCRVFQINTMNGINWLNHVQTPLSEL